MAVVPIVVGVLGSICKGLIRRLEELEIRRPEKTVQTTALVALARILRNVLET